MTRGNGSQHAIVIRGNGHGFKLEDLAAGQINATVTAKLSTQIQLFFLAVAWVLLLITAAGLKQKTWFLLGVGTIGTLQNIYVVGAPRRPENFGIPLDFVEVFGRTKAMEVPLEVEKKYQFVGQALLYEFFPSSPREEHHRRWADIRSDYARVADSNTIRNAESNSDEIVKPRSAGEVKPNDDEAVRSVSVDPEVTALESCK